MWYILPTADCIPNAANKCAKYFQDRTTIPHSCASGSLGSTLIQPHTCFPEVMVLMNACKDEEHAKKYSCIFGVDHRGNWKLDVWYRPIPDKIFWGHNLWLLYLVVMLIFPSRPLPPGSPRPRCPCCCAILVVVVGGDGRAQERWNVLECLPFVPLRLQPVRF